MTEGMPTVISGMPSRHEAAATRRSQASTSSRAPPSTWPWSRAMRGHRDLLEGSHRRPERPDERPRPGGVEIAHRRHVDPRRERASRSLEHDDAERRVGAELPESGAEGVDEGRREDVQRRAGQREAGDAPSRATRSSDTRG